MKLVGIFICMFMLLNACNTCYECKKYDVYGDFAGSEEFCEQKNENIFEVERRCEQANNPTYNNICMCLSK